MSRRIERILANARIQDLPLGPVCAAVATAPLEEVYRLLADHRTVVVLDDGRVLGIFTERDVLRRTARGEYDSNTPIGELMTRDAVTVGAAEGAADAVRLMVEGHFRQVPVVDAGGRAAGILRSRDILRFIADHYPAAVLNLPPRLHQQLPRPEGG